MLASRNLEDDSVGHMMEYLNKEESTDFRGHQEFKLQKKNSVVINNILMK